MWPYVLAGGATLLGMQAGRRAGGAEIDAGAADMTNALVSGSFREKGISEKRDRVLSSMRARAGASWVEMTGSPLEVLLESSKQAQRDLTISRFATQRDVDRAWARISQGASAEASAPLEAALQFGKSYFDIQAREAAAYKKPNDAALDSFPGDITVWPPWKWGN